MSNGGTSALFLHWTSLQRDGGSGSPSLSAYYYNNFLCADRVNLSQRQGTCLLVAGPFEAKENYCAYYSL